MEHKIKLVIVGDGIAAWMCAAALIKRCDDRISKISLIQHAKTSHFGIETSLPSFQLFNASIGINEREFMCRTHACFSLGTKFNDWGNIGDSYFQPFGTYGDNGSSIDFLNHWLRSVANGNTHSLADYSYCIDACKHGVFDFPQAEPSDIKSTYNYAYQFDAQQYIDLLKEKFSTHLKCFSSAVNKVHIDNKTSFIESITLDNGDTISADYFIDCTESSALLIEQALGVKEVDCADYLPCDRMVSVRSDTHDTSLPYSIAQANSAGWQWQCHSQSQINHAYIYDSKFISDEQALSELITALDSETLSSPTYTAIKSAYRKQAWYNNCIALGESATVIDPLESSQLYLIQQAILNLIDLFPNKKPQSELTEEYNRRIHDAYLQTSDLLTTHYYLNQRTDSDFWQHCQNIQGTPALVKRLQLFTKRAYLDSNITTPFSMDNWISVLLGQGRMPKAVNLLYNNVPIESVEKKLRMVLTNIHQGITTMPTHKQFIANYCVEKT